jgi:anti-sigma B factor antagonist
VPVTFTDGRGMSSSSHSPQRPVTDVPGRAAGEGASASAASARVIGYDGSEIATVSRYAASVSPDNRGPEVVVSVRGDLDLDTAPLAEAILLQALDGADRVCLDLGEVQFFGAAGIRVIIKARLHAAERGRALRLAGVHGITERVLTLTGLYPPR